MKELNQIITDYLRAENTDYAIMIKGEWGYGKSYYLNNDLARLAEGVPYKKLSNEDEHKFRLKRKDEVEYFVPYFISLYGLSSSDDFYSRVFAGINKWASNGWFGAILSKGFEFAGVGISSKDYKLVTRIPDNAVLVFDDLERVSDNVSINEVLGLLNSYIEHLRRKVIIVCNELPFSERDKENYSKVLEKTVRFAYSFSANISSVFDNLTEKKGCNFYKKWLIDNKKSILEIFELGGEKNLRTLIFFLDLMEKIFYTIPDSEYKVDILSKLLISTLIYCIEYKKGNNVDKLLDLKARYAIDLDISRQDNQKEEKQHTEIYYDEVSKIYGQYYEAMTRNEIIVNFIATGYLDTESFSNEIISLEKDIKKSKQTPEGLVFAKLSSITTIKDSEIIPLIDEMMSYVDSGKYNLYDLLNVYALLLKYHHYHVEGFEITEAIDQLFKNTMDKVSEFHVYNSSFEIRTPIWGESDTDECKMYKNLKKYAMILNYAASKKEQIAGMNAFLSAIESGNVAKISSFREDLNNRISLSGIDWSRVYLVLEKSENEVACELCICLEFLITDSNSIKKEDMDDFINVFVAWLNNYKDRNDNRIRRIYILDLLRHVNDILSI